MKILTLYTPHSDTDERVTLNFIRTVQVQSTAARLHESISLKQCVSCDWSLVSCLFQGLLKGRSDGHPPQLLMDVRRVFPVTFPYSPPPVLHAEQLVIPDSLKISFLRRA